MVNDLYRRTGGSGFWITGAINQSGDAGMDQRSRAHGAGLNRGDHGAAHDPMVSQSSGRLAQGNDLSMGRRIIIQQVAIMAPAKNFTVLDN